MGPVRVAMLGTMGYNRWIPYRSAPLALTTLKSLNAEIKQL
jgi:DNA-binding protein H-NS